MVNGAGFAAMTYIAYRRISNFYVESLKLYFLASFLVTVSIYPKEVTMGNIISSLPYGNILSQMMFIGDAPLTEKNLPSQQGKVFIVTGGYAGVGLELSKILYAKGGTVYVAGRSAEKGHQAITSIKSHYPNSPGKLEYLHIDLADLTTIKPAADTFLSKEKRLDVLTNNAGVMFPPATSTTAQSHEITVGTNCLGPFLLTELLTPLMNETASSAPTGSVRVTWAGSLAVDTLTPTGGITFPSASSNTPANLDSYTNYGQSKVGNLFLATESARRYTGSSGVLHVCWNPGNLRSELQRHLNVVNKAIASAISWPAVFGAYTELYAGWSQEITPALSGSYVLPWGRVGTYRADIAKALKGTDEGGTGQAQRFWDWCDKETKAFA